MKIIYFDVETTGFDPKINDITQLAGIIEVDGEIMADFNFHVRPHSFENISLQALETTGKSIEDLKANEDPHKVHKQFVGLLSRYVSKFDKNDKFVPAGYNVHFDLQFLREFFLKCGDAYFGSFFNYKYIDPLPLLFMMESCGKIKLDNYKLSTVCTHYKILINAHDALSDIKATRDLCTVIREKINVIN